MSHNKQQSKFNIEKRVKQHWKNNKKQQKQQKQQQQQQKQITMQIKC